MELAEIITPDRVFGDVTGESKKKVLETAAGLIAQQCPELDANELFDKLISREKLGSTGLGQGIAIPHCRASHCSKVIGTFLKLASSVDFDSLDHQPVDMLFVLLVPQDAEEEHLNVLSKVAQLFNDEQRRTVLRNAQNTHLLYQELVKPI